MSCKYSFPKLFLSFDSAYDVFPRLKFFYVVDQSFLLWLLNFVSYLERHFSPHLYFLLIFYFIIFFFNVSICDPLEFVLVSTVLFFFLNFGFIYLFIYVCMYGCVGSSFLCEGFL